MSLLLTLARESFGILPSESIQRLQVSFKVL